MVTKSKIYMKVGDNILHLRKEQNMTQEKFATLLGVSRQAVQKWENGVANPDIEHISTIAKLFNVSVDYIMLGTDKRSAEVLSSSKKIRPDYANIQLWEPFSKHIMTEYRQCFDEGKNIAIYEDLFNAVSKMPANSYKEKICDVLFEMTLKMEQRPDYKYDEPNDYEEILEARPKNGFVSQRPLPTREIYENKIAGAWLGRIVGCLLGKPVETIRTEEFDQILISSNNKPLHRYILSTDITDELRQRLTFRLNDRPYADTVDRMPWDDDTNYTVLGWKLIETYGRDFTPANVALLWLDNQPRNAYWTAERVAFTNFVNGYYPPESASYKNSYREWIGAQIRGDYFGYINPGNPVLAADMAYRDACISHVKNGIYGEMFVSAMIATAATETNIENIILGGLAQIPEKSRLYEAIVDVLRKFRVGMTQEDMFIYIHERFDEHVTYDWCHTISNAMIVTASLLYGAGDFSKSICMAVETGFDTDCNGATVGSILGMRSGTNAIPAYWSAPIHNTLETTIREVDTVTVDEMVRRTMTHVNL